MLHLTTIDCWESQRAHEHYVPEAFATDGFIHCTHGDSNVIAVGNRYYAGEKRQMVCLFIDANRVESEIRYEDPERIFPHIYGPLNVSAVTDVLAVARDEDGTFRSIGESLG
jgi:uncharacterized protein (DUF952 family)